MKETIIADRLKTWRGIARRINPARIAPVLLVVLLTLIAGGCVTLDDPEASQDFRSQVVAVVRPEQSVGQTFVARRAPLKTIQLWLRLESDSASQTGMLTAELYHAPGENSPLTSVPLSASVISNHFPVAIAIPELGDPPEQSYYLKLTTTDLAVQVFGRDEDAYPRGTVDQNNQPLPGDLSFRLSYDYNVGAMQQDLRRGLIDLWLVIPLVLTLWLPGWLLMEILQLSRSRDWGERIALAVGLSLAVIAVGLVWITLLGLRLNRTAVIAIYVIMLCFAALRSWRHRSEQADLLGSAAKQWSSWALLVIFGLSLWVRMAMVRDLAAPPWVELGPSWHHHPAHSDSRPFTTNLRSFFGYRYRQLPHRFPQHPGRLRLAVRPGYSLGHADFRSGAKRPERVCGLFVHYHAD